MECLAAAFADNEAPAAPLDVDGTQVSLVVLVPSPEVVPDRRASITASGNLSLKKLTKTDAAQVYRQVVFGHLLVTLREAFAVAPGLQSARIVAIRRGTVATRGGTEVLLAATSHRTVLSSEPLDRLDAGEAGRRCLSLLSVKGVAKALQPVPLSHEPDLQRLLAQVEFE